MSSKLTPPVYKLAEISQELTMKCESYLNNRVFLPKALSCDRLPEEI